MIDDYISREVAVEKITFLCELREIVCAPDDEFLRGLKNVLDAIKSNEIIPSADVQPAPKYTENMSTIAFCDRFICKNCDLHLEDWVKVFIDPDDGEELHYEYEFKYCPECGAKIVEELE